MAGGDRRGREPDAAARGRGADAPAEMPARGWRDVALRVREESSKDHIGIVAAGVAFYWLLSLFPGLAALVSIYGLTADPATLEEHVRSFSALVPPEAYRIVADQIRSIAAHGSTALGWATALAIGIALWSATRGTTALVDALNIAYDESEKRGFVRRTALAIGLTAAALVGGAIAIGAVVVLPPILDRVGLGAAAAWAITILRWPLLAAGVLAALAVLYRFAPSREEARWSWVSPGAVSAMVLWLIGSIGFSLYVDFFGRYDETYGSLGGVVLLLTWFWLTAYVVLLGAEINAEAEKQTARDTTTGPERPMGRRGARAADTLGHVP